MTPREELAALRRLKELEDKAAAGSRADFSQVQGGADTKPQGAGTLGREMGLGGRAMLEGIGSTLGMVTDLPARAVGLPSAREGFSSLADTMGLPEPQTGTERVGGQITEALTGGGGVLGGARMLGRHGQSMVTRGVGNAMATAPRSQLAGLVGGAGAAGATREQGGGAGAQTLAGLLGGLSPAAVSATAAMGLRGLLRGGEGAIDQSTGRATGGRLLMEQNIEDFRSVGAQPSVGQATGNRRTQGLESLLAGGPTSGGRMADFAERQAQDIGGGLQRRANEFFPNASAERAGRAIERGADSFAGEVKAMRTALYNQADQLVRPDTLLPVTRTQQAFADLTRLTPGAESTSAKLVNARIADLAASLGEDVMASQGRGIPYQAVKELRSRIGEELSDFSLSPDRPTAQYKRLYAALSQDMEEAARQQGPAAEAAMRRANNYTRASSDRLEQVQRVVDKNGGPEKVYNAVMAGTQDGGTTLRAVMQSLPKDGQRAVTAAVIKRMGLATPGNQNAAGDVFSAQTFLTKWGNVSPEAKRALFDRHGPKFAADMDKIARVAENIRNGAKVYANPAGTANRAAAIGYYGSLAGTAAAAPFTGGVPLAMLIGGGVSANVAARVMTSPKVVSWLARTTEMPAGALPQQLVILQGIAEDDPDAAELLGALQQAQQPNR